MTKPANAKSESKLRVGRHPKGGRVRWLRVKDGWRKIRIYPGGYVAPLTR